MKSILLTLSLLMISNLMFSQDEIRDLKSYSSLHVSGGISVDLHYGDPRAEITLLKGDIERLKTEIKGDELKIYFDNKKWGYNSEKNKAKIDLYFKNLDEISVSAGSSLQCDELLKVDEFDADASSGARMELSIKAKSIDSNVSSGASIAMSGEAKELDVDVSSGGSFRGAALKTMKVDANASSGGVAKVWATESIKAGASSGGSVRYKGDPEKKNLNPGKWSGGQVEKL